MLRKDQAGTERADRPSGDFRECCSQDVHISRQLPIQIRLAASLRKCRSFGGSTAYNKQSEMYGRALT
jgi:hypothetical protein